MARVSPLLCGCVLGRLTEAAGRRPLAGPGDRVLQRFSSCLAPSLLWGEWAQETCVTPTLGGSISAQM